MGSILFEGLKLVDSYVQSYVTIDLDETSNNLDTKPILSVMWYCISNMHQKQPPRIGKHSM